MRAASAVVLVCLTVPALAQSADADDPVALVSRAEQLVAKKELEDAALLLWRALAVLSAKDPHPILDAAALSARDLLVRHDPLELERRRVFEVAAKHQLELAQAYRSKKWFEAALTRIRVAQRFDRDAALKERAALEAAKPKPKAGGAAAPVSAAAPANKESGPCELLRRENTEYVLGDWRIVEDCLESPKHEGKGQGQHDWVTKSSHADHEIVVEFRALEPAKRHHFGILLGVTLTDTKRHGYEADIICNAAPEYCLRIASFGTERKELGFVWLTADSATDGFHRLSVQVHGDRLRAQIDGAQPLEVTAPAPVRGFVGLSAGLADNDTLPVRLRNFRIGPLPADAPTDEQLRERAQADLQKSITAAVDEARSLLAKKQPEQASLVLRDALVEVRKLPAGVLRTNLAASMEQMLAQADSVTPKRKKAAQAIAAELAGLADKYAAAGKTRLALWLVDDAAGFDPDAFTARLAAAREAVAQWNVAQAAARANELAPPADDGTVLRDWFQQGRRLLLHSDAWTVEGAAARVQVTPENVSVLTPRQGAPAAAKAEVYVHLPRAGDQSGFAFDIVSDGDYAVGLLERSAGGLTLYAFRFTSGKWTQLARKPIPMDAWRLDGWFALALEHTATGITLRAGGAELVLDRKRLGKATGKFGLFAANGGKDPVTIELRAFRIVP